MKTVHIIALHLDFGGIEKAIISMANLFSRRYRVEIISVYKMGEAPAFPLNEGVSVRYLLSETPNRAQWKAALKSFNIPALIKESAKSIKILINKRRAVIKAIKEISEGVVITTRHEDNLLLSRYGGKNVMKIAQLHHDHNFEKKYIKGFRKQYRNIDTLLMLTPGLTEETKEYMRGFNTHTKLMYMPNFLEHYPALPNDDRREKRVVSVGRLNPIKGFDRLIDSFARIHESLPDWQLVIVGEGAEHEKLSRQIEELGAADYISLTGKLDGIGVEREMLRASIYAMSSHTEGFPFVLLEAQSCGLPIVAYDVRVGPAAVVNHEKDGLLIKDGDSAEFENQIIRLARDGELRREMGRRAAENAARFSEEEISGLWFELIGD